MIATICAAACATTASQEKSKNTFAAEEAEADAAVVSRPDASQAGIPDIGEPEDNKPENYTVNFASGSVALDAKLKKVLRPIFITWAAARKNQCPDTVAIIIFRGHSDEELYVDKTDRNDMLALQRAQSVRRFAREVFGDQQDKFDLRVESYGDSMPEVDNDTPEHRMVNRRVVIEAEICP